MRNKLSAQSLDELNATIENHLDNGGPFAHNMIGIVLSEIDKRFGKDEANNSIELFGLDMMGWRTVK